MIKRKIYVFQYCILSGSSTYNTGFFEYKEKITSAKQALELKKGLCSELELDENDCSIINLNIIGERDE